MTAQFKQRDISHGWCFDNRIEMRYVKYEHHKENETEKTQFELESPVGYNIGTLRGLMHSICKPLIAGERKRIEMHMERFPQVHTVMGEINASIPKNKRLEFGWTTDDDTNTFFFIQVPKRK